MGMKHVRRFALAGLLTVIGAPMVAAHPHVFVDTGLRIEIDAQGNLRTVEVT